MHLVGALVRDPGSGMQLEREQEGDIKQYNVNGKTHVPSDFRNSGNLGGYAP